MKILIQSLFFLSISILKLNAQQFFIPYGRITYEKRVNIQRSTADWNIPDAAREKMKKYRISEWELYFDMGRSLYKTNKKAHENDNSMLFPLPGESGNELYSSYPDQRRIIKKGIMGEDYLLSDTIPKVAWKLSQELRIIAGYECRKAIGRISDTIYVVAFYTDEILLKGGPEGFSGLPGMILGLAIPRFNTTWFATKVEGFSNYADQIVAPLRGKKTDSDKDLQKLLEIYSRYQGIRNEKPEETRKRLFGFLL